MLYLQKKLQKITVLQNNYTTLSERINEWYLLYEFMINSVPDSIVNGSNCALYTIANEQSNCINGLERI